MKPAQFGNAIVAGISFISSFYSAACLMIFLSSPNKAMEKLQRSSENSKLSLLDTTYSLIIDYVLLAMFIIQHSVMASSTYKGICQRMGICVLERSIYNIATSLCLLILVQYWRPVLYYNLWELPINSISILNYSIITIHFIAWGVVYGGSLLMDIPEIFGIKQVLYDIKGLSCPMSYKSTELKRLYEHMRHPSFTALAVIFWCTPIMSLDRLLLALMWSGYMLFGWKTDSYDVEYQHGQLDRKKYELHRLLQKND